MFALPTTPLPLPPLRVQRAADLPVAPSAAAAPLLLPPAKAAAALAVHLPPLLPAPHLPSAAQEELTWTLVRGGSEAASSGAAHSGPRLGRCPPMRRRSPPARQKGAGCWAAPCADLLLHPFPACIIGTQGQNYQPKTFTDGQTLKFVWTGGWCCLLCSALYRRTRVCGWKRASFVVAGTLQLAS